MSFAQKLLDKSVKISLGVGGILVENFGTSPTDCIQRTIIASVMILVWILIANRRHPHPSNGLILLRKKIKKEGGNV